MPRALKEWLSFDPIVQDKTRDVTTGLRGATPETVSPRAASSPWSEGRMQQRTPEEKRRCPLPVHPDSGEGPGGARAMDCISENAMQAASAEPVWGQLERPAQRHGLSLLPRVGLWALILLGVSQYVPTVF